MRPLRLLLSLSTCILTLTLLLYVALGAMPRDETLRTATTTKKSKLKALFSFTSPTALFPPSAIISLTDDNSTFFLARPAAFGPVLPTAGLSGSLWIGSGFGDEAMGTGELGCSDVPDWNDGQDDMIMTPQKMEKSSVGGATTGASVRTAWSARRRGDYGADETKGMSEEDGAEGSKMSGHADIQSIQEAAEIAGKVVLLKRGGCGFLEKVMWAQRRGGIALIVGDNVRGEGLIRMYAQGDTSNVSIPALFTSHTTAHLLASLLSSEGHLQGWDTPLRKGGKSRVSPTSTLAPKPLRTGIAQGVSPQSTASSEHAVPKKKGWLTSFLSALGLARSSRDARADDSRRPPSSGNINWVQANDWENDNADQKPATAKATTKQALASPAATGATDGFVIGEQDWRDPDLLPQKSPTGAPPQHSATAKTSSTGATKGGSVVPGSGEYGNDPKASKPPGKDASKKHKGWLGGLIGDEVDDEEEETSRLVPAAHEQLPPNVPAPQESNTPDSPHEGLWVTLTPTNMATSPFFDTLLVLVVSPLVTLTVVYALLLARSRIRRRRWRAPKSVVERLPVRTYHTISDASPSPTATPGSSSPTTPLLQHHRSRSPSAHRPRSRATSEEPATSSSVQRGRKSPEEEKREHGLAEWRRRYGGRQKECVVCLDEYEDGVSRVMSLPCGHEFHADCITPWLVTRRRTCPICKGDVVRSLSQSHHDRSSSPPPSPRVFRDDVDSVQVQAAETRNESPSASQPVPVAGARYTDDPTADVEANWDTTDPENQERGREIPQARPALSSSLRELSSTVQTTIWRGFDAIRGATGLQGRPSQEELDRDR
ncbi:hypothetical protein P154DRAFT_522337 [Amniculicola lignicola CBS 123094]|uniref:RING-type E3 ubiquitin transferase n=1 Tax=Amniculicola lignicola CBS 123094 TaxID=1392246 RepID=A0A6A5WI89_9PLEO|nr:hypothetical protein P154DRAFT_522337 [Amniculicola lignicola CBS 123094]